MTAEPCDTATEMDCVDHRAPEHSGDISSSLERVCDSLLRNMASVAALPRVDWLYSQCCLFICVCLCLQPLMFPSAAQVPQYTAGTVLYTDLKAHLTSISATYPNMAAWCSECSNTAADVCLNAQLVALKSKSTATTTASAQSVGGVESPSAVSHADHGHSNRGVDVGVSLVCGIVAGCALGVLVILWHTKRHARLVASHLVMKDAPAQAV